MHSKPWTILDSPEGTERLAEVMQLDKVAEFSSANDFLACKAVARNAWIDTAKDEADSPHENKWPMTKCWSSCVT